MIIRRRDETYSTVDGFRPLALDLYLPADVVDPPVVVWIHGGGFRGGSRSELPATYPPDAVWKALAEAGIACASIDYRLSGEARWPAQRDDVNAAIAFLRARDGIDGTRLGTWGESAGGHLALMAAFTNPAVRAVVGWYPVTDLVTLDRGDDSPEARLIGARLTERPDLFAAASPVMFASPTAPPCLLVHGDADKIPVAQSEAVRDRLGDRATLRIVPGAKHVFEDYDDVPGLIGDAVGFLKEHL